MSAETAWQQYRSLILAAQRNPALCRDREHVAASARAFRAFRQAFDREAA